MEIKVYKKNSLANGVKSFFKGFIEDIKERPDVYVGHVLTYFIGHKVGYKQGYKAAETDFDNTYRETVYDVKGKELETISYREYRRRTKDNPYEWSAKFKTKEDAVLAIKLVDSFNENTDNNEGGVKIETF